MPNGHTKFPSMFGYLNDELDCILAVSGSDEEFFCTNSTLREEALIEESSYNSDDEEYYNEDNDNATNIVEAAAEDYRIIRDSGVQIFVDNDADDIIIDAVEGDDISDDEDYTFDDAWPDNFDCTIQSNSDFENTL